MLRKSACRIAMPDKAPIESTARQADARHQALTVPTLESKDKMYLFNSLTKFAGPDLA